MQSDQHRKIAYQDKERASWPAKAGHTARSLAAWKAMPHGLMTNTRARHGARPSCRLGRRRQTSDSGFKLCETLPCSAPSEIRQFVVLGISRACSLDLTEACVRFACAGSSIT